MKKVYEASRSCLNPGVEPHKAGLNIARYIANQLDGKTRPYNHKESDWAYCITDTYGGKPIAKVRGNNGSVLFVVPNSVSKEMMAEMLGVNKRHIKIRV